MPTQRYTGKNGAVSIGGVTYTFEEWEATETGTWVEGPAGGDIGTHRTFLRSDWAFRTTALLVNGAVRNPFTALRAGTAVAIAASVESPSIGVWSATGGLKSAALNAPISEHAKFTIEAHQTDGSAQPTFTP